MTRSAAAAALLSAAVTTAVVLCYGRVGAPSAPAAPEASVAELMIGVIAPHASAVFESVSYVTGASGSRVHDPGSAEGWAAAERSAALLQEGALLLMRPGRAVVQPRLVAFDRARWNRYAMTLHETAGWARDAARARSAERLLVHGGDITLACERCHLAFRQPGGRRYLPPDPE